MKTRRFHKVAVVLFGLAVGLITAGAACDGASGAAIPYYDDFSTNPSAWSNGNHAGRTWVWDSINERVSITTTSTGSAYFTTAVTGVPKTSPGDTFEVSADFKMNQTATNGALRLVLMASDAATLPDTATSFYLIGTESWGSTPKLGVWKKPAGASTVKLGEVSLTGVGNLGTADVYTLSVKSERLAAPSLFRFTLTLTNKTTGLDVIAPWVLTDTGTPAGDLSGNNYFGIQTYCVPGGTPSQFTAWADNFAIVPEPASWLLLLPAAVGLLAWRRRENRQARGA